MNAKLVLENNQGEVLRTFRWNDERLTIIVRRDTRRLELHPSVQPLQDMGIDFEILGEAVPAELASQALDVGRYGRLRLVPEIKATVTDEKLEEERRTPWYVALTLVAFVQIGFLIFIMNRPIEVAKIEQELKQHVVKVVSRTPQRTKTVTIRSSVSMNQAVTNTAVTGTKGAAMKRMGALGVLGSLNKGNRAGGLDLGAVKTTAGPGRGGTGGSGGVQSSLYGKGLIAAPVGPGSNVQGAGGYGTKGAGGGQAGYGKMSLIGSAGTSTIPLGREALVEGGLDRDLIADVIRRNQGQLRFCYEQGLQGDPTLQGRIAVNWVIGGGGQVKSAEVANSSLNSKQVEECVLMRLRTWKFPLPEGGVDVKVSYPFMMKRAGQG